VSSERLRREGAGELDGLLNVLKPPGMTSHDVVDRVRRLLGVRRVGHTGTLDPGAAGVLVLCVGRATRLVEWLHAEDKEYRAELVLGIATDTQDAFGAPQRVERGCAVPREALLATLGRFVGAIEQVPPMASAVKRQGRRLYELARAGVEVERAPRTVHIRRLTPVRIEPDDDVLGFGTRVLFDVVCSKGTYVRTLCADIGAALGCGAYMSFLLRTRVGALTIDSARTLDELERDVAAGIPVLLPMDAALAAWPKVTLDAAGARRIRHGQPVAAGAEGAGEGRTGQVWLARLYDENGRLLALAAAERRGGNIVWRPRVVFS